MRLSQRPLPQDKSVCVIRLPSKKGPIPPNVPGESPIAETPFLHSLKDTPSLRQNAALLKAKLPYRQSSPPAYKKPRPSP